MDEIFRTNHGLATLSGRLVEIRNLLDDRFVRWAVESNAEPMLFPPLLRIDDLDRFDHFRNFPQLPTLASRIDPRCVNRYSTTPALSSVPSTDLDDAAYALPSAACYNIYLHLKDMVLLSPRYITTVACCFRNEKEYMGLRRLWSFSMREIVCIGQRDAVGAHLSTFRRKIEEFARRLGLSLAIEIGTDPFFQPDEGCAARPESLRALTQRLFPTKEEFVHDKSVAIASVNFHRNFFGERCRIRTEDNQLAFTGCVAFGLERWLHALLDVFKNDPVAISSAIRDCG